MQWLFSLIIHLCCVQVHPTAFHIYLTPHQQGISGEGGASAPDVPTPEAGLPAGPAQLPGNAQVAAGEAAEGEAVRDDGACENGHQRAMQPPLPAVGVAAGQGVRREPPAEHASGVARAGAAGGGEEHLPRRRRHKSTPPTRLSQILNFSQQLGHATQVCADAVPCILAWFVCCRCRSRRVGR